MDLPINDQELETIVSALRLGGDAALYQKLKLMKDIREQYPGGAYKKICLLYTSPSPRDRTRSRMPSSA